MHVNPEQRNRLPLNGVRLGNERRSNGHAVCL
jgi:hypothetical protein